MKSTLKVLIGLVILAAIVFFGGVQVLPDTIDSERHVVIAAPPEKIFAMVSDLHRFNEWSPWSGIDPNAVYKYEGPQQGVGQKMTWSSANPALGNGTMTVTFVKENLEVESDIEVSGKPKAVAVLSLAPAGKGTGVTWTYESPVKGFVERWSLAFFTPAVEADLGKGLRNLKALVEKAN